MEQVLKLDKDCEEAVTDLFNCKVLQLMVNTWRKMLENVSVAMVSTCEALTWLLRNGHQI